MTPGFARDQNGEPWIVIERSGALWAIGLDEKSAPIIRLIGLNDEIHTHLTEPTGIRRLTAVKP